MSSFGSDLVLLREVEQIVHEPAFDELVETRIRRTRRARLATASALTIAAIAVIASVITTGLDTNSEPPVAPSPTPTPGEVEPQARPLVYTDNLAYGADARGGVLIHVRTLHVGDHLVEVDQEVNGVRTWSIAVTDEGAAYIQIDHSVWFTDGGRPRQIAQRSCGSPSADENGLGFRNVGSLVAWFDCSAASLGDLVVYDTSLGHEVARYSMPQCQVAVRRDEIDADCYPQAIIGNHLYIGHFTKRGRWGDRAFRLELSSGQVIAADPQMYDEDVRARPRALIIGDSWETGAPSDSADFRLDGSRLIPGGPGESDDGTGFQPTEAFDTATGQPVRFRIPRGYHPDANNPDLSGDRMFTIIEWLDDDTVALQHGDDNGDDILTCHLSDGRCVLAAESDGKYAFLAPQPAGLHAWNIPG